MVGWLGSWEYIAREWHCCGWDRGIQERGEFRDSGELSTRERCLKGLCAHAASTNFRKCSFRRSGWVRCQPALEIFEENPTSPLPLIVACSFFRQLQNPSRDFALGPGLFNKRKLRPRLEGTPAILSPLLLPRWSSQVRSDFRLTFTRTAGKEKSTRFGAGLFRKWQELGWPACQLSLRSVHLVQGGGKPMYV